MFERPLRIEPVAQITRDKEGQIVPKRDYHAHLTYTRVDLGHSGEPLNAPRPADIVDPMEVHYVHVLSSHDWNCVNEVGGTICPVR